MKILGRVLYNMMQLFKWAFVFSIVLCFYLSVADFFKNFNFLVQAHKTTALVEWLHAEKSHVAYLRFHDQEKKLHQFTEEFNQNSYEELKGKSHLEILYNPKNPQEKMLYSFGNLWSFSLIMFLISFMGAWILSNFFQWPIMQLALNGGFSFIMAISFFWAAVKIEENANFKQIAMMFMAALVLLYSYFNVQKLIRRLFI